MRRPDFSPPRRRHRPRHHQPRRQGHPDRVDNLVDGQQRPAARSPAGTPTSRVPRRGRGQRLRRQRLDGLQGRPPHRQERGLRRRRGQAGARRLRARGRRREPRRHRRHLRLGRRRSGADGRGHRDAGQKGREVGQPVLHRQHAARHGVGPDRHRARHQGPEHVHRHGLLDRHPQHRRGGRGHPPRRLHRGHHAARPRRRSTRSATSASRTCAAWARRARVEPLEDDLAAVRQDAQRLRARRGRGRAGARGPRVRQGARRARSTPRSWATARPPTRGTSSSRSRRATARGAPWRWRSSATACPRDEVDLINPHGTSTPLGRPARGAGDLGGLRRPHAATSPSAAPSR